ncbi:uncharacterized protein RSE6_02134 [Rhynchosporium secalis]|uniref:Uncharacterized protein n=1 Tax=Rhynchosporium secalis TaxID=38038 RepID=A0A1E1LZI5_RHYSE|nr:uncharacterized protein RSE6_02134 [Rhynchosporium secalis]
MKEIEIKVIKAEGNTYLASLLSSKKRKRTSDNEAKDADDKEEDEDDEDKGPVPEISLKDHFKNRINTDKAEDDKDKDLEDFIVKEESGSEEDEESGSEN